jgi:hypothetical protein
MSYLTADDREKEILYDLIVCPFVTSLILAIP